MYKHDIHEEIIDKEPEIVIPLKNFNYSNTTIFEKKTTKFLGRVKELNRLKDHLIRGHKDESFRGSILVAGFRGAGKTRFVNKAIYEYKSYLNKRNKSDSLINVRINLGSERNIDSKTVLFSMVSLLKNEIEEKSKCPLFRDCKLNCVTAWVKHIQSVDPRIRS